jgi:hypothetical protein
MKTLRPIRTDSTAPECASRLQHHRLRPVMASTSGNLNSSGSTLRLVFRIAPPYDSSLRQIRYSDPMSTKKGPRYRAVVFGIECRVERRRWEICQAKLLSWPSRRSIRVVLTSPSQRAGHEFDLPLENVPDDLRKMRVGEELQVISSDNNWPVRTFLIDPWQKRDEFISLRPDTEALLRFLNRVGNWSEKPNGYYVAGEFWDAQRRLKTLMRGGLPKWVHSKYRKHFQPEFTTVRPHVLKDKYAIDGIFDSVSLDLIAGDEFKICSNPSCKNPFAVTREIREYCSRSCKHCASMRRNRLATKKSSKARS